MWTRLQCAAPCRRQAGMTNVPLPSLDAKLPSLMNVAVIAYVPTGTRSNPKPACPSIRPAVRVMPSCGMDNVTVPTGVANGALTTTVTPHRPLRIGGNLRLQIALAVVVKLIVVGEMLTACLKVPDTSLRGQVPAPT